MEREKAEQEREKEEEEKQRKDAAKARQQNYHPLQARRARQSAEKLNNATSGQQSLPSVLLDPESLEDLEDMLEEGV